MESEMAKKQAFLREQILSRQYDVNKFIEFLDSKLHIGDDLTLCTFQQLKSVVQIFIATQDQDDQEESSNYPQAPKSELLIKTESAIKQQPDRSSLPASKPRTIVFEKYNFAEPQFSKTFRCVQINERFKGKQLHIQVGNPQRKTIGGFFGIGATSFLEFQVKTIQTGWKVGRRYSDFIWLRDILRKKYPTQIVPPIPQKKAAKRTQRHVQKRMRILQYFLNDLVRIPEFKNNRYVDGFLRITQTNKLAKLKEESEKQPLSEGTSTIQTSTGQVTVRFNAQVRAYQQEMKLLVPQMERLYKAVTRQGKALQNTQLQQVNTLYQMGNLFAQLHQKSREVLNRVPKAQGLRKLNGIFVTLNNMMIQWGNLLRGQFQIIQKNFNTFFKYVRNDLHGYLQCFSQQQSYEQEFAKAKVTLDKRKQKIYSLFDVSKWQLSKEVASSLPKQVTHDKAEAFRIMLPRENTQLQKLRIRNCLLISQLYANGDDNFSRCATKFQQNFKQWSIKIKVNTQQIGQLWSEMSASFSGEGKSIQLKEKPIQQNLGDEIMDD